MLLNSENRTTRGSVHEDVILHSEVLHRDVLYSIYLPPDYHSFSTRKYQVLYLLHGAGGDNNSWIELGGIANLLDDRINLASLPPMIVVMPDGRTHDDLGSKGFYSNSTNGKFNYEEMFMTELMPLINEKYKVKQDKKHTFIGGNSMGGYGALYYSLKYPERFKAAFSIGGALLNDEILINMPEKMYNQYFGNMIGFGLESTDRLNESYREHSILDLFEEKSDTRDSVAYLIDCGDKDNRGRITETNMELHINLVRLGVVHEFRMEDGVHSWDYWRARIGEALEFINHKATNK